MKALTKSEKNKAEALAFIFTEFSRKADSSSKVFITPDLINLFLTFAQTDDKMSAEIISFGSPMQEPVFKVGYSGMLNNIAFSVIEGYNKCYVAENVEVDELSKIIGEVKRSEKD